MDKKTYYALSVCFFMDFVCVILLKLLCVKVSIIAKLTAKVVTLYPYDLATGLFSVASSKV